MKPAFITALAALATSAVAAPANNGGIVSDVVAPVTNTLSGRSPAASPANGGLLADLAPGVHSTLTVVGQDTKKLLVQLHPSVVRLLTGLGLPQLGVPVGRIVKQAGNVGDLLKDLGLPVEHLLTVLSDDGSALLIELAPEVRGLLAGLLPSLASPVGEVVHTLGHNVKRGNAQATGNLLEDSAPGVKNALRVVGQDAKQLLIQLSPEVAGLLSGLGLPGLAGPVGSIVYKASSVGDLITHLGPSVQGLLAVAGQDGGILLISLAPEVAGLVSGLGLPTIATPVGGLLHVVGNNL